MDFATVTPLSRARSFFSCSANAELFAPVSNSDTASTASSSNFFFHSGLFGSVASFIKNPNRLAPLFR